MCHVPCMNSQISSVADIFTLCSQRGLEWSCICVNQIWFDPMLTCDVPHCVHPIVYFNHEYLCIPIVLKWNNLLWWSVLGLDALCVQTLVTNSFEHIFPCGVGPVYHFPLKYVCNPLLSIFGQTLYVSTCQVTKITPFTKFHCNFPITPRTNSIFFPCT